MRYGNLRKIQYAGLIIAFVVLLNGFTYSPAASINNNTKDTADVPQVLPSPALNTKEIDPIIKAAISESYGKLPLRFEANKGQVDESVKFLSRGSGYTLFLTSTEAVLSLRRKESDDSEKTTRQLSQHTDREKPKPVVSDVIRLKSIGANPNPKITGVDELPGKSNYFIGNDPKKWRTDVPGYAKVKLENVYPGIDLVYYGNQRQLEFDWVVSPGVDPSVIQFQVEGKGDIKIDDNGDLILDEETNICLNKPVIFQEGIDGRHTVAGGYELKGENRVGVRVDKYDTSLALMIDPILSYSTYLGGTNQDFGLGIAVDTTGNAYVTGFTRSDNSPTVNSYQTSYGGSGDGFIFKLNPAGNELLYYTYLGGSLLDTAMSIAVDANGNAYVTGWTSSTDFPTLNPFQPAKGSGTTNDSFIAKLNSTGNALVYSTYLGGSDTDYGRAITVDVSGNAYVAGDTLSTNFPMSNPFQPVKGSGTTNDAFIAKMDNAGNFLVYSTYLGGSNDDNARGIAVDASCNVYVTGYTLSTNFPTLNAFQAASAGNADVYITKLNSSGNAAYSTYLGGSAGDYVKAIAIDKSGNAYLTGQTFSGNFPTENAYQPALNGNDTDAFVTKLSSTGNSLVYSTYLGGHSLDVGNGISVDVSGNAITAGITSSTDFPVENPYQATLSGDYDAFVTKLNGTGNLLYFSSYLGGTSFDTINGIAAETSGNVYVTGDTKSDDFPTAEPLQATMPGSDNAFITKISFSSTMYDPDFNHDGKADILWRNQSTGKNSVWHMDGVSKISSASLPSVSDTTWVIVGTPDFNADGKPDILWRNTSTGKNAVYYMNGVSRTGTASLSTVSDTTWMIVGTADFNADGHPDILWRNTSTGKNSIYYMNGVSRTGSASLSTVSDTNWAIVGTPDLNADGHSDILWRNTSTGKNAVYYMNGVIRTGSASLPSVSDTSWAIVGTQDFNADGHPDILWRNMSTGKNSVWYMDGVSKTGSASISSVSDTTWTIVP